MTIVSEFDADADAALPINFRDVGLSINRVTSKNLFKTGLLFRGGAFNTPELLEPFGFQSVIGLHRRKDPIVPNALLKNIAPAMEMNNYISDSDTFLTWINGLFESMCKATLPAYIHCTAGKDRTGVAIALILKLLGYADDEIVSEYLLSEGETYEGSLRDVLENTWLVSELKRKYANDFSNQFL